MLRLAPLIRRELFSRPIGTGLTAQWLLTRSPQQRCFADIGKPNPSSKPSVHDSDSIVLPGTQSSSATSRQPPPPGPVLTASPAAPSPASPTSNFNVPPQNVPLMPPSPPGGKTQTAPPTSIPPTQSVNPTPAPSPAATPSASKPSIPPTPPSAPPSPKRRPRRFRRFLLYLILLGGVGYAGGVYYSLLSDNFHDFFTEYIPFGENAVLYFEEREYRQRFPKLTNPSNRPTPDSGKNITIPSKSGVSWKVAGDEHQGSDLQSKEPHMSALGSKKADTKAQNAQQTPSESTGGEKVAAVQKAKKEAGSPAPSPKPRNEGSKAEASQTTKGPEKQAPPSTAKPAAPVKDTSNRPPEVDEPSRAMPMTRIDPLGIKNADEPLVQDLVKIINDIITVVNDDNSSHKYSSTITKAKSELANVGSRIMSLKQAEKTAAKEEIRVTQSEFDTAAKELVRRLEDEMKNQESRWRDEFESEREKMSQSYQQRVQTETKRAQEVAEQKARNVILEQAVTMKQQFLTEVTDRVETERAGRLSKLSELSSSVTELEKLTADWNSVIDENLKTQHLQVAVEAVRSTLETADRPRPFIKELAALKEISSNDPLINAAVASINPTAYQRGIPTSAQLIDRFRRVAAEVRKASLLPEDAGVAGVAASFVLSKFLFKKQGMTMGDDIESVLTRTETLLEEGNLDEAAREMNTLEGWAKTLSWDWLSECRRVLEVRQAMDVIATQARLEGLRVDG